MNFHLKGRKRDELLKNAQMEKGRYYKNLREKNIGYH
jgi:hypothetical protein